MKPNYECSTLDASHLKEVFHLSVICGMHQNLEMETWSSVIKWALLDNPYRGGKIPGHVVKDGKKIIGFHGYQYVPFALGGWRGNIPNTRGLCVHPSYRGGLGVHILKKFVSRQIEQSTAPEIVITSHGISKMTQMVWRNLGAFDCPGTGLVYHGLLSLRKVADSSAASRGKLMEALSRKGLNYPIAILARLLGRRTLRPATPRSVLKYPYDLKSADEEQLDMLSRHWRFVGNTGIFRSAHYLRWRYCEHPLSQQYHVLALEEEDGNLVGIIVLRLHKDTGEARVCEILYNPEIQEIREDCVSAAAIVAKRIGAATLTSMLVCEDLIPAWRKAGMSEHTKVNNNFWISAKPHLKPAEPLKPLFTFGDVNL